MKIVKYVQKYIYNRKKLVYIILMGQNDKITEKERPGKGGWFM